MECCNDNNFKTLATEACNQIYHIFAHKITMIIILLDRAEINMIIIVFLAVGFKNDVSHNDTHNEWHLKLTVVCSRSVASKINQ